MRRVLAIMALLAAVASSAESRAADASAQVRRVLKSARCDKCHDSSVAPDNARALAVYDLVETEWPARMKDAQLPKLLTRLRGAPVSDQKIVRDFIDAELTRRSASRR